jgi:polar amino acid transport system substrate-binding protein
MFARLATVALAGVALLSSCADARDAAGQTFTPRTDGVLTVAAALPAPGFWDGDVADSVDGGFEWGLATRLAERFGLELRVIDVPFEQIVAGDLGAADLALAQISITNERASAVDFSIAYYVTDAAVLGSSTRALTDLRTARDLRWAVVRGTTEQDVVDDQIRPVAVVLVADESDAAEAVRSGAADAALMDLPTAMVLAQQIEGLTVVAKVITGERYGAALPIDVEARQRARNREAVDAALRSFDRDGTMSDLRSRWLAPLFASDPADLPVIRIR